MALKDLITAARVRNRISADLIIDITDTMLDEYVEDACAYVEEQTHIVFLAPTDMVATAKAAATSLAVVFALSNAVGAPINVANFSPDGELKIDPKSVAPAVKTSIETSLTIFDGMMALLSANTSLPISTLGFLEG